MTLGGIHVYLVFVYFFYGLAFFSLGLAMAMEAGRSPLLAAARILWPLGIFGLLHGLHEWLEILILQGIWFGLELPGQLSIVRLCMLAVSFVSLLAYGIRVLHQNSRLPALEVLAGGGMLILYVLIIWARFGSLQYFGAWIKDSDVLARYLLAVPGALTAALALRHQAGMFQGEGRFKLGSSLRWASAGFLLYGITQLFVPQSDFFPAFFLNAGYFYLITGVPVQAIRAVLAIVIAVSLIRATNIVEEERQKQLETAHRERFEAMERVRRELIKREEQRRELLRHTVIAQEEERARIARELHDESAQTLTAASLNLASLKKLLPDRPQIASQVERLQCICQDMSRGLYRMVHDLRPAQLDDLGLVSALQYLVDEGQRHTGIRVGLQINGRKQRLDPLVETVLFRVVQEALTNVARHAGVERAEVRLDFEDGQVFLEVEDLGSGFDPEESMNNPNAWGLAGMRERTESVGGRFSLRSSPDGGGTLIKVEVPTRVEETDTIREA